MLRKSFVIAVFTAGLFVAPPVFAQEHVKEIDDTALISGSCGMIVSENVATSRGELLVADAAIPPK